MSLSSKTILDQAVASILDSTAESAPTPSQNTSSESGCEITFLPSSDGRVRSLPSSVKTVLDILDRMNPAALEVFWDRLNTVDNVRAMKVQEQIYNDGYEQGRLDGEDCRAAKGD